MLNLMPMPHDVEVVKSSKQLDEWGLLVESEDVKTFKARVSYNTSRQRITVSAGTEVVYTADIYLEGVPIVEYLDTIRYTDQIGNVIDKKPLSIEYKTDFSGNAYMVKVVV